ncbi:MAG: TetR/AcrR family transcriptional regulator [Idiomarina sp.]
MARGPNKQFDVDEVLEKAINVFARRGYEAATMSELLTEMGIGKKSLYDTFGNKESLFFKATGRYARLTYNDISERLNKPGSPLQNIRALFTHWKEVNGKPGSCGCLLGTSIADFNTDDTDVALLMRGHLQRVEDLYVQTLKRAQDQGEIAENADVISIARMLLCASQGMSLLGRVMENGEMLSGVVDGIFTLLDKE